MRVCITPSSARGSASLPPSKSVAHRLLILAAFADGESCLHNIPMCDDVLATLDCLRALGIRFQLTNEVIHIQGKRIHDLAPNAPLPCRASASTLRFLIPMLALTGQNILLCAEHGLLSRPMNVYEQLFSQIGAFYEKGDGYIKLCGNGLPSRICVRADVSSQFISGLLMAFAVSGKGGVLSLSTPVESRSYIELTLDALHKFGVMAQWQDAHTLYVSPTSLSPICDRIEGDLSSAAFLDALNRLGGEVHLEGVPQASQQGDRIYNELFDRLEQKGARIDLADCPDLGPILFSLAAAKHGAIFTSIARLRLKECDRIAAMTEELSKLGAELVVRDDALEVISHPLHSPSEPLSSHGDHRIAMALAPLLALYGGVIDGAEAVSKSFPDFWACMRSLGISLEQTEQS